MKIYLIRCGAQYEDNYNIKAWKDRDKALAHMKALEENQISEDEEQEYDSGIIFWISELEYEE